MPDSKKPLASPPVLDIFRFPFQLESRPVKSPIAESRWFRSDFRAITAYIVLHQMFTCALKWFTQSSSWFSSPRTLGWWFWWLAFYKADWTFRLFDRSANFFLLTVGSADSAQTRNWLWSNAISFELDPSVMIADLCLKTAPIIFGITCNFEPLTRMKFERIQKVGSNSLISHWFLTRRRAPLTTCSCQVTLNACLSWAHLKLDWSR